MARTIFPKTNISPPKKRMVGRRSIPFGFRPIFRGQLLVLGRVHHSRKLTWQWKNNYSLFEDVSPIKSGVFPHCHVSFREVISCCRSTGIFKPSVVKTPGTSRASAPIIIASTRWHISHLESFNFWARKTYQNIAKDTLPETNIAMENPPFWWYLPGKIVIFMGYVSFREGTKTYPRNEDPRWNCEFLYARHSHVLFLLSNFLGWGMVWQWKNLEDV